MFAGIGLVHPKNNINVGAALRAANCYQANFVVTTGQRYKPALTDTQATFNRIPLFRCLSIEKIKQYIPYGCVPVAVDLIKGAKPLPEYEHPPQAFYLFGPEDGTLGHQVTSWCRDTIYIPTAQCMNLAATVNVVLYDRFAKGRP